MGLVARQHSSGNRTLLLGISKRGSPYLRTLIVHGARTVLQHAPRRDDPMSRWGCSVQARRGKNRAVIALANKMARRLWATMRYAEAA